MVNPSFSRRGIHFLRWYCQFCTAFLLALLIWALCGLLGDRSYWCMIFLTYVMYSLAPVSLRMCLVI